MRSFIIAIVVASLAGLASSDALGQTGKRELETYSHSEPLEDIQSAEVVIELGLAKFELRSGAENELAKFDAAYDSRYTSPKFEIDRKGDRAYLFIYTKDVGKWKRDKKNRSKDEYQIYLSPKPVYDMKCEVGLGDNRLDLSGLQIKRLTLESGLASTELVVDQPNQVRAERVKIENGLGDLKTQYLGNLRFNDLSVEGGMGSSDLDLRGFEGEGNVSISVGMGSCTMTVSRSTGVRIRYKDSFMSSFDVQGFDRVGNDRYESDNYEQAESKLTVELEVGMGSFKLIWRD